MTLSKEVVTKLKFIVRHDYANPNAKLTLTRQECIAVLSFIGEPAYNTGRKTLEHCSDCFNDNNELADVDFVVVTKVGRHYTYYCRHHFVAWFDLFIHAELGDGKYTIPYEIKQLRKSP